MVIPVLPSPASHGPASPEPEYRPVDLDAVADASVDVFEDPADVELGERRLHGLPFRFGTPERAVVRVDPRTTTRVPATGPATWLVFAHAVLEADLYRGGRVGDRVGSYTLEYADGTTHTHPLRQRFEIGPTPRRWDDRPLPLDWGQTPLLARNDAEHVLMDRSCGRYDQAGARLVGIDDPQSQVPYVLPYRFYLWALENPRPDADLTAVSVTADEATLLLGALTLSRLDEEPFTTTVAREVLLDIRDGDVDETVEVDVDRGSATYVYRTTPDVQDAAGLPAGWGAPRPSAWPTGYTKISASPSATVTVRRGGHPIGEFRWADLVAHDVLSFDWGTVRLPRPDQNWVRTRVRDAAGRPVPCRIRFQTLEGIPIAPYGHHAHINSDGGTWNLDIGGDVRLGSHTYAAIDGDCEGWLPAGEVQVEVVRGFEHEPVRRTVTIAPDQGHLDLVLERRFDARERGYLSGDTHVHFMSTHGAELEARAEDLHIANLLLAQWGEHFTGTEEFTGHAHVSHDHHTVVYAGQENRTNMLGHINLLGLKKPIMPWSTGGSEEDELGGGLATTLSHWADECHAQGGTVVLAHFPVPYGETAALLATGRLDAVETIAYDDYNVTEYYRYLNAGFRVPLVGGTDKMTSEVPVGLVRTYASTRTPGATTGPAAEVDHDAWCAGIRRGDTMVSSGPLLWLTVDDEPPGSVITGRSTVHLRVELETIFPVDRIEVVRNGEVLHTEHVEAGTSTHLLDLPVDVDGSDWLLARCFGSGDAGARHTDTWARPVVAHTSPVYVSSAPTWERVDREVIDTMLAMVEGARRHVTEEARTRWHGAVRHRHGEPDHLAHLTRPFDEATAALHARLGASGTS
ncbi:CehA/McbA family metallohydrolase [Nocardioides sp. Arc9.136]|uniref:CehA/McbA family metallohydrolase n=1 Tax=Nocardioides sp. Arc9.136 TaxID=2996826 RepID=UPI0026671D83|nr:CehA/McbA family metallohydrolase [Nocardioides sp. Arc9.136]WKN46933.1 CehA/McbA family metallohydrolase [Nocardioides sp. Arc9.136]